MMDLWTTKGCTGRHHFTRHAPRLAFWKLSDTHYGLAGRAWPTFHAHASSTGITPLQFKLLPLPLPSPYTARHMSHAANAPSQSQVQSPPCEAALHSASAIVFVIVNVVYCTNNVRTARSGSVGRRCWPGRTRRAAQASTED